MSWATRRKLLITLIFGAIVFAFISVVLIATLKQTPTCTDGVQNQGEAGVDCGGPCPYLCTAQELPPTVLFTTALTNADGRTDIAASVENKNINAAARNVPYTITIYGTKQIILQTLSGTLDLPPGATATVYIPGARTGKQTVVSAFLTIAPSAPAWFTMTNDPRTIPGVSNTTESGSPDAPRIDAVLTNGSAAPLSGVQVVVLVRNVQGSVIAASQTVVPTIPAQGQATATFTWNNAFPDAPASIEVVPVIPLP